MISELEWWQLLLIPLFVILPALRFHAVYVLWHVWKAGGGGVALERLVVATTGSVGSLMIAALAVLRLFGIVLFPISTIFSVIALVMFNIPAFMWEYMYQTGRLGNRDADT